MAAVQQTNSQTPVSTPGTTAIQSKKDTENPQDRFLNLLKKKKKNQDPLKPMDNAEVTSQMAQISTVSGIEKLNTTLKLLTTDMEDSMSVEATAMIGHEAFAPGNFISLQNGKAMAGVEFDQAVDRMEVTIVDSAGATVRVLDLGPQPVGLNTISWDGKTSNGSVAADGEYTFVINATQGENSVKGSSLSLSTVKSVTAGENGALLDMGKLGLVNLSDIKRVF